MSGSFRYWPRLAAAAALTALVMAALLGLLVKSLLPARTPPTAAVAQSGDTAPRRDQVGRARVGEIESPGLVADLPPPPPRGDTGKSEPAPPPPRADTTAAPVGPPDKPKPEPAEAAPARYKAGDAFMQEVVVTRQSAYRILGAEVGQKVGYAFTSRFTVDKVERDGGLVVKQKVESARFSEGDADLKEQLADALKKTRGSTFEMTFNAKGELTRWKGGKEPLKAVAGNNPLGGQTFLLLSLLDEDAWKELAQVTFFTPDKPLKPGAKWARKLSHSWGPLGGWTGQTVYTAAGKQLGMERINYADEMTYQAPRGGGRDLPFAVKKADFKPLVAGGAILFDATRGKVANVEETFRVRGAVVVTAGDVEAAVEVDETQVFRVRITEAPPLQGAK